MTAPDVAIIVPVLRRPHRIRPLLKNLAATTPAGRYRVLFVCTPHDRGTEEELGRLSAKWLQEGRTPGDPWSWMFTPGNFEGRGDYARKINLGYWATAGAVQSLDFHRCR